MYFIFSGVIQGCPHRGLIFAISADPLVCSLARMDAKLGSSSRWCADDCASLLTSLRALTTLDYIFQQFKPLTGLVLNYAKINRVILSEDFGNAMHELMNFLQNSLAHWTVVAVTRAGWAFRRDWEHFSVNGKANTRSFRPGLVYLKMLPLPPSAPLRHLARIACRFQGTQLKVY